MYTHYLVWWSCYQPS